MPAAMVYVYRRGESAYPMVVADIDGVRWLVMLGMDGVMETAFPPEDAMTYLADAGFTYVGTLEELGV
jgi:hypothetical protein